MTLLASATLGSYGDRVRSRLSELQHNQVASRIWNGDTTLWTDDPDSRVKLVSTAYGDMMGLLRLRLGGLRKASMALRSGYQTTDGERPSTGSRP